MTTPSFTSEATEPAEFIEQPPSSAPPAAGWKRPARLTLGLALVTVLLLAAVGVLSGALVGASHRADAASAAVEAAKEAAATASASASAQLQQAQATASAAAARASTAEAAQSSAEQAAQAARSAASAGSPSDQKFLAALAAGAPDLRAAAPGSQLISAAHAACTLLGNQILPRAEAKTLAESAVESQGWTATESSTLVDAAISAYCPSN